MTFKVASAKVKFQVNQPFVQKAAADSYGSGAPARPKWKRSFDFNSQLIDCERQVSKVNPSFPMSNSE